MRFKVVYVLVSRDTDWYFEQMALSIYSLRLHNPEIAIEIVTDEDTEDRIKASSLLPNNVKIVSVTIPSCFQQIQKSRYLKTQLRKYVEDTFLYLDTDTIVCDELESLYEVDADIAMVADNNGRGCLSHPSSIDYCNKAGFTNMEGLPYFNGGVMFCRPSEASYSFFERWHTRWLESVSKGISLDQPALCKANQDSSFLIKQISDIWNLQIDILPGVHLAERAMIIHYYHRGIIRKDFPAYIRRKGLNDAVKTVVKTSKLNLISLFTISDERLADYISSDMIYLFESYPSYYRLVNRIARLFLNPYKTLSKIKQSIKSDR